MADKINVIKQILSEYKQEHLLNFYEKLSDEERENLINEIQLIDFKKMQTLFENSKKNENLDNRFSPINYVIKEELNEEQKNIYNEIGKQCIKNSEVAILTMAGGQGSRLGVKGPKGTFKVETKKGEKSLFEIIYYNIREINEKYKVELFWLIMTSEDNDKQTKAFFESNNYFNYNKDKIIFFKQNKNPILNVEGKLVLQSKCSIKQASNGNGDVFEAIKRNNLITILKENGVKYISFGRN